MPEIRFHANGEAFLAAVEPSLVEDEARYSLAYGLARRFADEGFAPGNAGNPVASADLSADAQGHLLTVSSDGQFDLAAWHTPPHAFSVTGGSGAGLLALADWLCALESPPGELYGPAGSIAKLTSELGSRLGCAFEEVMSLALFKLGRVIRPTSSPPITVAVADGANPDERRLVMEWTHRFAVDCGLADEMDSVIQELPHLDAGSVFLARDARGTPTSMVAVTRTTPQTANISYVYTPPERRGAGNASALVAAVSQRYLDAGKLHCTLFTDLANPTSNRIYQAIGFERVETFRRVRMR